MKPFRLATLALALAMTFTLAGCDNNNDDKPTVSATPSNTDGAKNHNAAPKADAATLEKLAQHVRALGRQHARCDFYLMIHARMAQNIQQRACCTGF